jgi:hypothetical protein
MNGNGSGRLLIVVFKTAKTHDYSYNECDQNFCLLKAFSMGDLG